MHQQHAAETGQLRRKCHSLKQSSRNPSNSFGGREASADIPLCKSEQHGQTQLVSSSNE